MVTRHSCRTVRPPMPESKTPTGLESTCRLYERGQRGSLGALRRFAALLGVFAAAAVWAGAANAFTKTDGTLLRDDGVTLATTLYLPDGTPPAGGWPGILMLHGLGGSRQDMNALAEAWYVAKGYAVLTYDARGHGQSGGVVEIDGPKEIGDVRAAFDLLASQPGVDRAHIGGWGVSYGGGAEWLAAAAGVPFATIE